MKLTPEQVLFFHLNGFLAIEEPITDEAELARMREVYDRIFDERAGRDVGEQFDLAGPDDDNAEASLPQILNPTKYAPDLAEGKFMAALQQISKQLFGQDATPWITHAIFKPAGTGAETPWHQDEAYWDPAKQYQSASIWMPLQEATLENGCLWFMPGSHEWEVVEHRPIGGDPRVHGLEMVDLGLVREPVACPLPAGGVTIHRNRTAHYSGPNRSGGPRRALILSVGLAEKPYPGERRFPWNEVKKPAREERARSARS